MRSSKNYSRPVSKNIDENRAFLENAYKHTDDVFFRDFVVGSQQAFLVAAKGFVNKQDIGQSILSPLKNLKEPISVATIIHSLFAPIVLEIQTLDSAVQAVLYGNTILFIDGLDSAVSVDTSAQEQRNVQESTNEAVIRGPHLSFIENLVTNIALLRRFIKNHRFKVEFQSSGSKTNTNVALVYMEGIAYPEIIDVARKKLGSVPLDAILDSGMIEQIIEENKKSLFPTVFSTERPDVVAAGLMEGRVAILVDGSPSALIVPSIFIDNFSFPDDYYTRPYYSSFMRIIRLLAFALSVATPSLYVAVENFHKEFIPSDLLVSIASAREGIPFPLGLEVLILLIGFELIKESGLRMPQPIGQAVSVVGSLILGNAAVDSGFVGTPTVIVAAVSGLSSFLVPFMKEAVVLFRFLFLIPATTIGLYGVILSLVLFILHLSSLKSMGVPYLAPFAPSYFRDWKDTLIRIPIKWTNPADKKYRFNIGRYLELNDDE